MNQAPQRFPYPVLPNVDWMVRQRQLARRARRNQVMGQPQAELTFDVGDLAMRLAVALAIGGTSGWYVMGKISPKHRKLAILVGALTGLPGIAIMTAIVK